VVIGGATGVSSVVWTQPDGAVVTEKLSGPGTETLAFANAVTTTTKGKTITVSGSNLDPDVSVTGSTGATKVSFSAKGGSKVGRIGNFSADADINSLSGKGINLDGDLTSAGSFKSLTLNGANDGAITMGLSALFPTIKLTAAMTDEQIHSSGLIKSISAPGWVGTSSATSGLVAAAVGSVTVKGSVSNTTMTLTAPNTLDLAKLSIGGAASSLFVNATGNIGAISAASMANTIIYAGIGAMSPGQVLPNFPSDFASEQSIKSVKVKTGKTPTFSNSSIAAASLGSLALGRIQTANGGTSFGVAATAISSLTGVDQTTSKKISMHKVTSANISSLLGKLGFSLADFVIKMF
jgi:hypothetical protein